MNGKNLNISRNLFKLFFLSLNIHMSISSVTLDIVFLNIYENYRPLFLFFTYINLTHARTRNFPILFNLPLIKRYLCEIWEIEDTA